MNEATDVNPQDCPDRTLFARVLNDKATAEEVNRVCAHLERCEVCRQAMAKIDADVQVLAELRNVAGARKQAMVNTAHITNSARKAREKHFTLPQGLRLDPPRSEGFIGHIDGFDIQRVLGFGAMGIVLKAYQESLNRCVAIKVMNPVLAQDPVARRRFTDEVRHIAELTHENIVPVHAVGEFNEIPFCVMQYVKGQSLAMAIEEQAPFSPVQAATITRQILLGLGYAHAHQKVHRDVKPANILLENHLYKVKIADFGLAVAVAQVIRHTGQGHIVGTPAYMSPEQAAGEYQLDARSDLFSVGSVLYEMLTGLPPFRSNDPRDVMRRVRESHPPPIRSLNPHAPHQLVTIVERAMQKDITKRYQCAADFVADLTSFLEPEIAGRPTRARLRSFGQRIASLFTPHPGKERRQRILVKTAIAMVLLYVLLKVALLLFTSTAEASGSAVPWRDRRHRTSTTNNSQE